MFVCSNINACRPTTRAHKLSCIDSGSLFCATGMTDQRDLPLLTHEQLYRNKELNVQIIKFSLSVFLPYFTHAVIAVFFSPPPSFVSSTACTHAFVIRAVLLVQSKHTSACGFICRLSAASRCKNVNEDAVAPILSALLWTICSIRAGSCTWWWCPAAGSH